jgi:hypothetical protein
MTTRYVNNMPKVTKKTVFKQPCPNGRNCDDFRNKVCDNFHAGHISCKQDVCVGELCVYRHGQVATRCKHGANCYIKGCAFTHPGRRVSTMLDYLPKPGEKLDIPTVTYSLIPKEPSRIEKAKAELAILVAARKKKEIEAANAAKLAANAAELALIEAAILREIALATEDN